MTQPDDFVVLAAALLGALVGGALTFLAQIVSDRARERARAREAAAMLRAEITRAQTAIAMLVVNAKKKGTKAADLTGHALLSPPGAYFDQLGLIVFSQMPIDWFTHVMSLYARWNAVLAIARELEKNPQKITRSEWDYVEDWLRDADVAGELLFLTTQRWWPRRLRYRRLERAVRDWMRADTTGNAGQISAAGLDEYFTFGRLRRRKR